MGSESKKTQNFSLNQVKEILEIQQNTILAFFNATVERLEKKIEKITTENGVLRKEVADFKEAIQFNSNMLEDKLKEFDTKL